MPGCVSLLRVEQGLDETQSKSTVSGDSDSCPSAGKGAGCGEQIYYAAQKVTDSQSGLGWKGA